MKEQSQKRKPCGHFACRCGVCGGHTCKDETGYTILCDEQPKLSMTQDTNNQEWWMEELESEFPLPKILAFSGEGLKRDKLIAFIHKVSQQSREDALKECVKMIEDRIKEQKEFGVQHKFTDHRISELQYMIGLIEEFKLPPKQ